jgi:hypothetical protein
MKFLKWHFRNLKPDLPPCSPWGDGRQAGRHPHSAEKPAPSLVLGFLAGKMLPVYIVVVAAQVKSK